MKTNASSFAPNLTFSCSLFHKRSARFNNITTNMAYSNPKSTKKFLLFGPSCVILRSGAHLLFQPLLFFSIPFQKSKAFNARIPQLFTSFRILYKMSPRNALDDFDFGSSPTTVGSQIRRHECCITPIELQRPKKRVRLSLDSTEANCQEVSEYAILAPGTDKAPENDYSTWLNRRELSFFRSCARKLCREQNLDDILHRLFIQADSNSSTHDCSVVCDLATDHNFVAQRGLEKWSSPRYSTVRSCKVIQVRTAVFLEQARQCRSGKRNPELLARITLEASRPSQSLAHHLASIDAMVAMDVRNEFQAESPCQLI